MSRWRNRRRSERQSSSHPRQYLSNLNWALSRTWAAGHWLLIGVVVCSVFLSLVPALVALVGRNLINAVVELVGTSSNDFSDLSYWLVAGFSLAVSREAIGTLSNYLKSRQTDRITLSLTLDILNHAGELDYAYFEDPTFQDIAERARHNAGDIFTTTVYKVLDLAMMFIETVSLAVVLIAVDPLIVIVMLTLAVPYGIYRWLYSRKQYNKEYSRTTKRRWTRYYVSTMTRRTSVKEVKLLNLAPLLTRQFQDLTEEFIREDRRLYSVNYAYTLMFNVLFSLAFYVLFYRIALTAADRDLTVGDVTLFAGIAMRLKSNIDQMVRQFSSTTDQVLYLDNLIEYFNVKPKVPRTEGRTIDRPRGEIEFRDVSFAYPGTSRLVLQDVDLHIQPGETVAIVGENGAGKTTLVSLIARLFHPDQGTILFDGIDINDVALASLHDQIAFVLQSFNQYEASAKDNIAYGSYERGLSLDQVKEIAVQTNVDELVSGMPDGYRTLLGRQFGQYDLSGGMWQKIAIARAMARQHASVLILDEPTASLDARAEWELFKQFRTLARERTTIIISHRFTTVSVADRIIMLERGRIVEAGTHHQLLELDGKYATLFSYYQQRLNFAPPNTL